MPPQTPPFFHFKVFPERLEARADLRTKVDSLSQQNNDLTNKVDSLTQKIDLMTLKLLSASVVIIVLVIILIARTQIEKLRRFCALVWRYLSGKLGRRPSAGAERRN